MKPLSNMLHPRHVTLYFRMYRSSTDRSIDRLTQNTSTLKLPPPKNASTLAVEINIAENNPPSLPLTPQPKGREHLFHLQPKDFNKNAGPWRIIITAATDRGNAFAGSLVSPPPTGIFPVPAAPGGLPDAPRLSLLASSPPSLRSCQGHRWLS